MQIVIQLKKIDEKNQKNNTTSRSLSQIILSSN